MYRSFKTKKNKCNLNNFNEYSTNACKQVGWDVNSWARVTRESHEHWSPTNNDDFLVCLIQGHCIIRLLRKWEKTITRFQEVLSRHVSGIYYILPMIFPCLVYRPSFEEVSSIAQNILGRVKHRPKIGIVCGSGLGGLADDVQDAEILPYSEIPTFPVSTGRLRLIQG